MRSRFVSALLLALTFLAPVGTVAFAEEPADETYDASLSETGFQPATSGEEIDGGMLMIVAYSAFWALMLGYVVFLARKQRAVRDEVIALARRFEDIDDRLDDVQPE